MAVHWIADWRENASNAHRSSTIPPENTWHGNNSNESYSMTGIVSGTSKCCHYLPLKYGKPSVNVIKNQLL